MNKIDTQFIIDQYSSGIENYTAFSKIGLWDSETYTFDKYLKPEDRILDLGCGTGRTTFALKKKGYNNIIGVDITPEMIDAANELKDYFKTTIDFRVGDACALEFEDNTFDALIFSFNGLMSIPKQEQRDLALTEIKRVLKPNGLFIFTTHDRDKDENYFSFWEEEKERWNKGLQSKQVYEFGDLITRSNNETRTIFIHIPDKKEIADWLKNNDLEILESFYRSDKFEESEAVKDKSGECRFWIARNTKQTKPMNMIKRPFNLQKWIDENRHLLKPPVGNKNLYAEAGDYIVMIVAGPNARKDYHYNETEELFYQVEGNINVRIQEDGKAVDIPINEGEMFLLPAGVPHSPMRSEGSIGLVIERVRKGTDCEDGLMWFCDNCNNKLFEKKFPLTNIEQDFLPVFKKFYASEDLRSCDNCGHVMEVDERFVG